MPERFIVGHLEDHVRQLEQILAGPEAGREAQGVTLPELGSSLPEIVLRTAIVYLFLVLILRLTGKREVGQMSILELIVILIISDAVQNSMVGENTIAVGRPGRGRDPVRRSTTCSSSRRAGRGASARPSKASRGSSSATARSSPRRSSEEGVDVEDVRAAARGAGIARLDDVRLAVLETDGSISIIPMEDSAHATTDKRSAI